MVSKALMPYKVANDSYDFRLKSLKFLWEIRQTYLENLSNICSDYSGNFVPIYTVLILYSNLYRKTIDEKPLFV